MAGIVDDFLGESTWGFGGVSEDFEKRETCGAFWAVFGVGVCDCVDFGELSAVIVEPAVSVYAWLKIDNLLQCSQGGNIVWLAVRKLC